MKIFITGISSGMGKILTTNLIKEGHEVWGIARRKEILEELQTNLASDNLHISSCDIGNMLEMRDIAKRMRDEGFIPDVIVLNAAVHLKNPLNTFDFGLYQKSFDINVRGALFWVAEFLQDFLKRDSGQFVAISSTSAFRHGYGGISYSASKAALSLTFRRLRIHFAKSGIKFSTIYFGPIDTELWRGPKVRFLVPSTDRAARYIARIFEKKGGEYYFPFFTTLLSRLSLLLPESLFVFFSKHLTDKYGSD